MLDLLHMSERSYTHAVLHVQVLTLKLTRWSASRGSFFAFSFKFCSAMATCSQLDLARQPASDSRKGKEGGRERGRESNELDSQPQISD